MKTKKNLSTEYKGVTIAYNEDKDRWEFNLRGVDRSSKTLGDARKAIDAPPPKDKKPFTRCKAWIDAWGWILVDVTSVVGTSWGGIRLWTTYTRDNKVNRSQEPISNLYADSPKNTMLIQQINAIKQQITDLNTKIGEAKNKLEHFELPKDTETGENS